MRLLKFRAWDKKATRMMKPVQIGFNDDGSANPVLAISLDGQEIRGHNNYILLQFTGLKDKKGVEIYEGDIVEVYSSVYQRSLGVPNKAWIGWVEWDNRQSRYVIWHNDIFNKRHTFTSFSGWEVEQGMKHKVIGNIYENPKLLQKD